ncbi:MAG: hypothetical protein ACFFE5_12465 [Candidatus Thorarchaeota archaeon]
MKFPYKIQQQKMGEIGSHMREKKAVGLTESSLLCQNDNTLSSLFLILIKNDQSTDHLVKDSRYPI